MSYNDYVYTKPIEVRGGIRAGSKRGAFGSNWWAKRWVQALEESRIGSRLDRGRSYARRGQVVSIDVQPGGVTAKVQGSRKRPYDVSIEVRTISPPDWERLQAAMAEQPIIAASLLSGRMPDNIEECFRAVGLSMFPTGRTTWRRIARVPTGPIHASTSPPCICCWARSSTGTPS